mmetsp:Transcript_16561/g.19308  ORF Transcript_16561/g.19308 Transcript_16561/m.19308 type:complete len:338 (-) Transcript_16561:710-1723(-)
MEEEFVTAAKNGDLEKVRSAFAEGVDPNYESKNGDTGTALYAAVYEDKEEVVRFLVGLPNIDVNKSTLQNQFNPLLIGTLRGRSRAVQELLQKPGIDVNFANKKGKTALMIASEKGRSDIIAMLLDRDDIDVNMMDDSGEDALMKAARYNQIDAVKLLLKSPEILIQPCSKSEGSNAITMARDNGSTSVVDALEDFHLEERKTEIGMLLKDNRLKEYCASFFKAGMRTYDQAKSADLTDSYLKFTLEVRNKLHQDKIRKLFGQLKAPPKLVKPDQIQVVDLPNSKAVTVTAERSTPQPSLDLINSLPSAPSHAPAVATAISVDVDDDDIPMAKMVAE